MIYEPGQVRNMFPYIDFQPSHFILAGPANGNEGQIFHEVYPSVPIIGLEPHQGGFQYQVQEQFPGMLLPMAIGQSVEMSGMRPSVIGQGKLVDMPGSAYLVPVVTLEWLNCYFGPFQDAILWMDIEGSEMPALVGGRDLLQGGSIRLMNIEIIETAELGMEAELNRFKDYLDPLGFEVVKEWNCEFLSSKKDRYRRDVIFRRKQT